MSAGGRSFGIYEVFRSQPVEACSTNVGFTRKAANRIVSLSSSGGGLFGRPVILTDPGRFLFVAEFTVAKFTEAYIRIGRKPWVSFVS
jgi:hypothetical protein